jgi:membrane protein required for colicin V production
MAIDAFFVILVVLACIKGFQRGLIVAVFSIIAFVLGLAAALKLSAVVAEKLSESVSVSAKWLPVISFMLVFLIVLLLVHLGAKMLQKSVEFVMLGWVNRLGGIIFYGLLYTIVFSVFLFYAVQLHLIKNETIVASLCYSFIQPLGPGVINMLGFIIPFFKDMFNQLRHFFGAVSNKMQY